MTTGPATPIDCGNGIAATAELAHVAGLAPGATGRTIVLITLSGGEVLPREALAEQVIAAMRTAVAPAPAVNRLAAVFAHLSQPPAPVPSAPLPPAPLQPAPLPAAPLPAAALPAAALPAAPLQTAFASPQAMKKFVPAIVREPTGSAPMAQSPYDAPFVLTPLHRPAG